MSHVTNEFYNANYIRAGLSPHGAQRRLPPDESARQPMPDRKNAIPLYKYAIRCLVMLFYQPCFGDVA